MIPYRLHILCATQWDRTWIIGTMIWSIFIFFHPFRCDYANWDKIGTRKTSQITFFMTHFSTNLFSNLCWISCIGFHMKVPNRFQHLFNCWWDAITLYSVLNAVFASARGFTEVLMNSNTLARTSLTLVYISIFSKEWYCCTCHTCKRTAERALRALTGM